MKRASVAVGMFLVVLMITGAAFAQRQGGRQGNLQRRQEAQGQEDRQAGPGGQFGQAAIFQQLEELKLTEDQKAQIEQIRKKLEENMAGTRDKMQTAMQELQKFREENPDDREGLQKKRQELMAQAGPLREQLQGVIEEVKAVLTEEQLVKFNEMIAQRGRGLAAGPGGPGQQGAGVVGLDPRAQEELQLTDEQKDKMRGLMQAYAEEQKQLVAKYQGLMKEMLTPEQAEKYEKMVAERGDRAQQLRERFGARGAQDGERPQRPGRPDRGARPEGNEVAPPPPPDEQ